MYDEETYDNLHYPSAEEEDLVQIKSQLLRSYVKEKDEDLDGLLLENIFEFPAETLKHLELLEIERKRQVFQHLVYDQQNESSQIGLTPSSIQSIIRVKRRQATSGFTEKTRSLSTHNGWFRPTTNIDGLHSPKGQVPNFGRDLTHNIGTHKSEAQTKFRDSPKEMVNTRLDKIEEEKEIISHDSLEASCSMSESTSRKHQPSKSLTREDKKSFNQSQVEELKMPSQHSRVPKDLMVF